MCIIYGKYNVMTKNPIKQFLLTKALMITVVLWNKFAQTFSWP